MTIPVHVYSETLCTETLQQTGFHLVTGDSVPGCSLFDSRMRSRPCHVGDFKTVSTLVTKRVEICGTEHRRVAKGKNRSLLYKMCQMRKLLDCNWSFSFGTTLQESLSDSVDLSFSSHNWNIVFAFQPFSLVPNDTKLFNGGCPNEIRLQLVSCSVTPKSVLGLWEKLLFQFSLDPECIWCGRIYWRRDKMGALSWETVPYGLKMLI